MNFPEGKKIALVGAKGMLASAILDQSPKNTEWMKLGRPEFDLTDRDQVFEALHRFHPDIIINCAAFTDVDGCETQADLAMRVNATGVGTLAEAASSLDATLVHFSTDYVFSGKSDKPYVEEDQTGPLSVYGQSKLAGEILIKNSPIDKYYLVRTSWLYGPGGNNFVEKIIRLARERGELNIVSDQFGSPTYTVDLAESLYSLLQNDVPHGVYHFSNSGVCSWYEFAREIVRNARAASLDLKAESINPIRTDEFPLPAKRPLYSVLSKEKIIAATGKVPPDWTDALRRYFLTRKTVE